MRDPYGIAFWPNFKGRDGCRTPMTWTAKDKGDFTQGEPWLPIAPAHLALSVEEQEHDPASTLHAFRRLLRWRNTIEVLRGGDIVGVDATDQVLWFERRSAERRIIAVFNLSDAPAAIEIPELRRARALAGHGLPDGQLSDALLSLPPHGVFFAEPA
jgi:alpha-glucosidase